MINVNDKNFTYYSMPIHNPLYKQRIDNNYALLIDGEKKCNLEMIKFKSNSVRFINFDIYL